MKNSILDSLEFREFEKTEITIGELIHNFKSSDSFAICILLLAIPNSIPIPTPPGFSSIFGLIIIIIALQMFKGQAYPKLPKILSQKKISVSFLQAAIKKASPLILKIENLVRPKQHPFFQNNNKIIGAYFLFCGFILFLPIPFGNIFSGISISICAISVIEKNMRVFLIGCLSMFLSSIFTFIIAYAGIFTVIQALNSLLQ